MQPCDFLSTGPMWKAMSPLKNTAYSIGALCIVLQWNGFWNDTWNTPGGVSKPGMPCEMGVGPKITLPLSISHASLVPSLRQARAPAVAHGALTSLGAMPGTIAGTPGTSGPPGHNGSACAGTAAIPAIATPANTADRAAKP